MYEVIVSPEAEADLDRIVRYLAVELENPQAAAGILAVCYFKPLFTFG